MDYPTTVQRTSQVAVVATFTAIIIGSDVVLSGPQFSDIKLMDTLVFASAYVFGFRTGAAIGVLSETIWSFMSPVGMAGAITPFLVAGELLFALAGWGASRIWGLRPGVASGFPIFVAALLVICAFLWDLETNFATALIAFWPTLPTSQVILTVFGPLIMPFYLAHEGSDLAFGLLVAPSFIFLIPRAFGRRP